MISFKKIGPMSLQATTAVAFGPGGRSASAHAGYGKPSGLSEHVLARHLIGVAALAKTEGDVRLAEHLVNTAYHLAAMAPSN